MDVEGFQKIRTTLRQKMDDLIATSNPVSRPHQFWILATTCPIPTPPASVAPNVAKFSCHRELSCSSPQSRCRAEERKRSVDGVTLPPAASYGQTVARLFVPRAQESRWPRSKPGTTGGGGEIEDVVRRTALYVIGSVRIRTCFMKMHDTGSARWRR